MKGISTIIATIVLAVITIGLISTAYLFFGGVLTGTTSKVISIVDVKAHKIIVRNMGTQAVAPDEIDISVNGQQVEIVNPQDIEPQDTAVLKFLPPEVEMTSVKVNVLGPSNTLSYTTDIVPHASKATSDTVGLWHFNSVNTTNHTLDETSYHNDGKLMNDTVSCFNEPGCIQLIPSKFDSAYSFDRISDYIEIPDDDSLDFDVTESFTIEMWVKSNNISSTSRIDMLFMKYPGSAPDIRIYVRYGRFNAYIRDAAGYVYVSNLFPQINTWYHLALVRDVNEDQLLFYTNGNLTYSSSANEDTTTFPLINAAPVRIGSSWNGTIDEVIILNRSLTQGEILDSIYG